MKRHVERRVGLARRFQHQIDRIVHAVEIDAKVRKPVFKADREHAMRALADCVALNNVKAADVSGFAR